MVAGEITTSTYVHLPDIVRGTLQAIGYTDSAYGIDSRTCAVLTSHRPAVSGHRQGVDSGGAGDQGMMFGYATDETPELMPAPILFAHRLTRRLAEVRHSGNSPGSAPTGRPRSPWSTTASEAGAGPHGGGEHPARPRRGPGGPPGGGAPHGSSCRRSPGTISIPRTASSTSTPPGASSSAGPTATPGSPAARSSWTRTGARVATAGGPSAGRTPPRWTAPPPTPPAGPPRTWWLPAPPAGARSSWPTPSGWPSPCRSTWTASEPECCPDEALARGSGRCSTSRPAAIIRDLKLRDPIYRPTAAYGHFGRTCEAVTLKEGPDGDWLFPWESTDRVA
jgi:S-adenosylmethionine synthetase